MRSFLVLALALSLVLYIAPVLADEHEECCENEGFAHVADGKITTHIISTNTPVGLPELDSGWGSGKPEICIYPSNPLYGTFQFNTGPCGAGERSGYNYVYTPNRGFKGIEKIYYSGFYDSANCGFCFGTPGEITIYVGVQPGSVPEFPTPALPAIAILGILATVLFIKKRR